MTQGKNIVGRTKNDTYDFYETPPWATEKAVAQMIKDGVLKEGDRILEPCAGSGKIVGVLRNHFEHVSASDIQTADYICGEKGVAVSDLESGICDVVFTNPPYNQMTKGDMLQDFLRISRSRVILLLNIYFLSSKKRKSMLEQSGLRHIYIHSDRVTMYKYGGEEPKNDGTKMYAWYVWEKGYSQNPTMSWI